MTGAPAPASPVPAGTVAVVVSWNRRALLERNLTGWLGQAQPFLRLVVVDNGSADGTDAWLAANPGATGVRLPVNRGFAGGANAGLVAALATPGCDAVALVNNDVALEPGWNAAARAALFSADDIGACATCLLQEDDPSRIDGAGIAWPEPGRADNFRHGAPTPRPDDEPVAIDGVSAGAALYRPRFLKTVGGFDERLFAYQEDVDLSLRGRRAGWRYLLAPAARGVHRGHASNRRFPAGGTYADFYNTRNRVWVLARHGPGPGWDGATRGALAALFRTGVRSLGERRAAAVWAGLLCGLARWPRARRAREEVAPAVGTPQENGA